MYLSLAAWRAGELDPKELGEVRGREVGEAGLQRALYRSSMGEIEHVLGPIVKGKLVVVEGHLAGTGRTALERLGAEVEELKLEDEKRYIDMTPAIFVFAAVAMAVRYVQYETPAVLAAAAASLLPDADYPKSWLGYQLGEVSEWLHEQFGHRRFLHSLLALALVAVVLGLQLWWLVGRPAPALAVFVGYGSHLFADMMTLGGVQLFWPSRAIAVFPGRDEYCVVSGGNSERVFVAFALVFALLFYPVSRVRFDGLLYRMGGSDQLYGHVTDVTDGDTIDVEAQGRTTPVRLIGVDTPEVVAPDQPVGCFGPEASEYTKRILTDRLVRLEIPRIGDSEDAYGRTLAYVYLDAQRRLLRALLQRGPRGAGFGPHHRLLPRAPPRVRAHEGGG